MASDRRTAWNVPTLRRSVSVRMRAVHSWWRAYQLGDWVLAGAALLLYGLMQLVPTRHSFVSAQRNAMLDFPLVAETVSDGLLVVLCAVVPLVTLSALLAVQRHALRACMTPLYEYVHMAIMGLFMALLFTINTVEILKHAIGRPRPNFYAMSGFNGTHFTASSARVSNAFQSFPSGHSASSFAGLGFLSVFLLEVFIPFSDRHRASTGPCAPASEPALTARRQRTHCWKTLAGVCPLLLAAYVACSRVFDYFHNYDDILAGACIGLSAAFVSFRHFYHYYPLVAAATAAPPPLSLGANTSGDSNTTGAHPDTPHVPLFHVSVGAHGVAFAGGSGGGGGADASGAREVMIRVESASTNEARGVHERLRDSDGGESHAHLMSEGVAASSASLSMARGVA